ncbi:MAG: hypothetical protein JWL71_2202 [Acidobacteria bacterium]|nr:hypothetical protein [Acidobacteriota bacterium]
MSELTTPDARRAARRLAVLAGLALLACATPVQAQPPHVRGDAGMQRLIAEAARRSPAIQEWIDHLQELDVTVYVRSRLFVNLELEGRVALLARTGSHRYLVIELACGRSELNQMVTLAHELFHAIEIAEEPAAISADTVADLYSRIGRQTGNDNGRRTFETEAAAAAGVRARRQLLTTTRPGNGT